MEFHGNPDIKLTGGLVAENTFIANTGEGLRIRSNDI